MVRTMATSMIDLNDIGKYRENNRIEAKKATGGFPYSLWETYSAFANTIGGIILLGVQESPGKELTVVGLEDPQERIHEFWETVNDKKKVSVNILKNQDVRAVDTDGKTIVIIEVPRASRRDKPVYINGDPFAGSYRRSGEGDYRCTPEEVRSMLFDRESISQDMKVLYSFGMDSLNYKSVRRYRARITGISADNGWNKLTDAAFLCNIGAAAKAPEDAAIHPTAAGLLMFGKTDDIKREFRDFRLEYSEKTDVSFRISSERGDRSGNIFDFYFSVYDRLTGHDNPSSAGKGMKIHIALREALANAVIHAYYYGSSGIRIRKESGKITVSNPGCMRVSLPQASAGGISDPRNAAIAGMFHLLGIGGGTGAGIAGINEIWKSEGWEIPRMHEEFGPDRTVLSLPIVGDESVCEKYSHAIIDYLTEYVESNAFDIAKMVGLNPSRTRFYLNRLIAENTVVYRGTGDNKLYRLKS